MLDKEVLAMVKELGLQLVRSNTILNKDGEILYSTSDEYDMAGFIRGYYFGYKSAKDE